jgi:hypothetical protein
VRRFAFLQTNLREYSFLERFHYHVGLVGLDFGESVAVMDLIAGMLEPADYFAFLHRVGKLGHHYFTAHGAHCS